MKTTGLGAGFQGFENTQWSVVINARENNSPRALEALERLCHAYWYPIYAFIRRKGKSRESAEELTQEFFKHLIDRQFLSVVDRNRGRFRSFLLTCVDRFLKNEYRKETAKKRGGDFCFVPLPLGSAEEQYQSEPADELSPDKLLDRRWAFTLLEATFEALRKEYDQAGKARLFQRFHPFLSGTHGQTTTIAEAAESMGLNADAARKAIQRMRLRFGQLLRQKIAETVTNPEDLQAELAYFRDILRDARGGG